MVEAHLRTCGNCRDLLRAQQALEEVLDEWEPDPISPDFNRRFWARVERENRRYPAARWFASLAARWTPLSWQPVASLAAACVLAAAALSIQVPNALRYGGEPSHPTAERIDVEQVERTLEDIEMLQQLNPAPAAEADESRSI